MPDDADNFGGEIDVIYKPGKGNVDRVSSIAMGFWRGLHCLVFFINRISVTFVDKDGDEKMIRVPVGMSMLEAAHENDIELEGKDFNVFYVLFICYSMRSIQLYHSHCTSSF